MKAGADGREGWSLPGPGFYSAPAPELAPLLLGCLLERRVGGRTVSGVVVETEAYTEDDPASHSHRGRTPRNRQMFGPGGRAYVYFTYGMHYCMNVTAGEEGRGEAVLLRALEPVDGIDLMMSARGVGDPRLLASGPARLCEALGIDLSLDGAGLEGPDLLLLRPRAPGPVRTGVSPRIGITRGVERHWRFYLEGSPFLSRRAR